VIELRQYQVKAISDIRDAIRLKCRRMILTVSTGGGKTLSAGAIIVGAFEKGNRCLFVAHRREIVSQTVSAISRLGVTSVGVIKSGDPREDRSQPIQVASIQTLARRPKMDPPPHLIFCDECHLSAAKSWVTYVFDMYPDAIIIGLTATPIRPDGKPLGKLYKKLIVGASYSELFAGGWLAKPLTYGTPMLPNLATVRTVAGDFNQEDLEKAVNLGHLIGNVVDQWLRLAEGRSTIVYAVTVAHSKAICDAFTMAGVKAEHLDGNTLDEDRTAILARLESGETAVVVNCNVLVEGFDCPRVKCVVLARPTKSIVVYMQAAGRALRPWENVTPLILDHAGCADRFKFCIGEDLEWSLSDKAKPKSQLPPHKTCPECWAYVLSALMTCPHCQHKFQPPPAAVEPERKVIPVDLALRSVVDVAPADLALVQDLHRFARQYGWHIDAIERRFEERMGRALPPSLKAAIRSDYKRDEVWKGRRREQLAKKKESTRQQTIAYVAY